MATTLIDTSNTLIDFLHSNGSLVANPTGALSIPKPFAKPILLIQTYIAGTFFVKHISELLKPIAKGDRLTLLREPENKYDKFAVLVKDSKGNKLGYVPRHNNVVIANLMDAGKMLYATVRNNECDSQNPDVAIDLFLEE